MKSVTGFRKSNEDGVEFTARRQTTTAKVRTELGDDAVKSKTNVTVELIVDDNTRIGLDLCTHHGGRRGGGGG